MKRIQRQKFFIRITNTQELINTAVNVSIKFTLLYKNWTVFVKFLNKSSTHQRCTFTLIGSKRVSENPRRDEKQNWIKNLTTPTSACFCFSFFILWNNQLSSMFCINLFVTEKVSCCVSKRLHKAPRVLH